MNDRLKAPLFASIFAFGLFAGCSSPPATSGGDDRGSQPGTGGRASGGRSGAGGAGEAPGTGTGGAPGAPGTGGAAMAGGAAGGQSGGSGGSSGAGEADAGAADAGTADAAGGPGPSSPPPGGGENVSTDLAKHRYSKVIKLDTTAAGAGVNADIAKYPVAVLLDAQNFDFSQAMKQGEDVRFADMAGKLLPYAIELWDEAGKKAALWVSVDVKGNNNTQAIVMHWGNPGAASAANSKAVFSKEAGFLGAWHLDEDGNTAEGGYKDASWNEAHGTGQKLAAGSRVPARVGFGTHFENPKGGAAGQIKWIEVGGPKVVNDFNPVGHPITVSGWTNANSWGGYYETIFSKGDGTYSLQRDYMGRTEVCMSPSSGRYHQCAITSAPPTKMWMHYMILRKDNPNDLSLFINGRKAAGTTAAGRNTMEAFGIANQSFRGKEPTRTGRGFDGIMDEVRVMSVERNADWAKLEYESQREGSKFLSFGPTMMK
jgi:Concanavalin A-like lectin/glucanases superfamily/Domain of unknown function (DUF2341)